MLNKILNEFLRWIRMIQLKYILEHDFEEKKTFFLHLQKHNNIIVMSLYNDFPAYFYFY